MTREEENNKFIQRSLDHLNDKVDRINQALSVPRESVGIVKSQDRIDTIGLGLVLKKEIWRIISILVIIVFISLLVAFSTNDRYEANATLAPISSAQSSSSGLIDSRFGGLASLAGIDLNRGSGTKVELALAVLKSRKFLLEFIDQHNIEAILLADEADLLSSNLTFLESKVILNATFPDQDLLSSQIPEAEKNIILVSKLIDIFKVNTDEKTGFVTIYAHHVIPDFAASVVRWLVDDLNYQIRLDDVKDATKNVQFLEGQLSKTSIGEMRSAIYQLVEEQMKTMMLAEASDSYVFKVIDPPVVPYYPDSPNRPLILIIGIFCGAFLGFSYFILKYILYMNSLEEVKYASSSANSDEG